MKSYRQPYAHNQNLSFLPAIVSTSTRMHGEFLTLLCLQAHRETEAHSTSRSTPVQARGILQVAEEQSRTRGDQSGGITNQPQCRFLWHSRSPSARSPSSPPPSFTQSPSPPRSLVRDGQTRPHRPRLVASRSTCPPPSPPPREQLYNRYCSSKHTTVINTHTSINEHTSLTPSPSRAAIAAAQLLGRSAVPRDLVLWRERSVHCTPSRSQLPHSKLPYF